ncbi:UDP-glucuronosyl/UDP-glucosyltransferase [Parasponia andersonii]|uniref:UDP-glucuronosyl/UDP-glucosyltransferase n=1 Tax=Parasponia andersonii TaxID=3476 RepID=A0A2P5AK56_PARAD|nr:UDP-glucuronosyl/UDP-glucosyltransferase [Parasponia andersonii]
MTSSQQNHVFLIATPAIGLLTPTVEFARRLVDRYPDRLSATVLLIPAPQWPTIHSYTQSLLATSSHNLRFLLLPTMHPPSPDHFHSYVAHISSFIDQHKPNVRNAISNDSKRRVVGLFVDLFCSSIADVADELGIPSYLFFTSPASFLSFALDLPILDSQLASESLTELSIRGFYNSVPRRVLHRVVMERGDGHSWYLQHARKYAQMKGIVVNTLQELEPFALDSLSRSATPRIYPVGPILNLNGSAQWHADRARHESIIRWLDNQPTSSVVFLCFGSLGSLSGPQVREIAIGLERAGFRFLWSLREPPKTNLGTPAEFSDFDEILPNGFLERTAKMGLVCGWVSQMTILSHQAIGGFVSHCGWNSTLESLWCGVGIATWPIYAEQHMNAFQMVKELGLSVEIRLDYWDGTDLVSAEEVETGIKTLMEGDDMLRAKVKGMREKCRMALTENGSSYESLGALVEELIANN